MFIAYIIFGCGVGLICFGISLLLGASFLTSLLAYVVFGVLATLILAVGHMLSSSILLRKKRVFKSAADRDDVALKKSGAFPDV